MFILTDVVWAWLIYFHIFALVGPGLFAALLLYRSAKAGYLKQLPHDLEPAIDLGKVTNFPDRRTGLPPRKSA